MPDFTTIAITSPGDLDIGLTTVATVCLALMIWIGLLGRASRATLLWTFALTLGLLGAYGSILSAAGGSDPRLHPVGIGLMFGMPLMIWSGLRAAQHKPSFGWIGVLQSTASVAALSLTTNLEFGFTVFRWLFLACAVGAALGAVELIRPEFRASRFGAPLVLASAAFVLLGTTGVAGSAAGPSPETNLLFTRGVKIATMIYVICATVTLLFLANRRLGARDVLEAADAFMPEPIIRAAVREKLLRAGARRERNWSFIDLRLDDAVDLREATGDAAFGSMVRRFEKIVADRFPAEVDLGRVAPGHVIAFAAHPPAAVRDFVRSVLNAVATPDADAPTTLRISASAGIVTVDVAADSYESLADAAAQVVTAAQREGGDRWRRLETEAL